MARNKYPEETHKRILDVSTKLFFEKGSLRSSRKPCLSSPDGWKAYDCL